VGAYGTKKRSAAPAAAIAHGFALIEFNVEEIGSAAPEPGSVRSIPNGRVYLEGIGGGKPAPSAVEQSDLAGH
jgi:hypothetical protein